MSRRTRFDKDYYQVMGLSPEAPDDEVRKAYRRLALRWHPDRNAGDPEAAERFKEISEAYAVLIDPVKRREYEASRRSGTTSQFHHRREDIFRDLFANPAASDVFEDLAREFERMGIRVDRHAFRQTLFGGRTVVSGGVFVTTGFTPMLALLRAARAALHANDRRPTAGEPARRVDARPASPLAPAPGILAAIGRTARRLLGLPASTAGGPVTAADLVLPLSLTTTEAQRGGKKRVLLNRGDHRDELLVKIPAGTRAGTRLRLRGKGRRRGDGSHGDVYLAVEIADRVSP